MKQPRFDNDGKDRHKHRNVLQNELAVGIVKISEVSVRREVSMEKQQEGPLFGYAA